MRPHERSLLGEAVRRTLRAAQAGVREPAVRHGVFDVCARFHGHRGSAARRTAACPDCGATKGLLGERDGEMVHITCGACGHRWDHDPWACPTCGERMHVVCKPLLQKARGTQQSIIGFNMVKA